MLLTPHILAGVAIVTLVQNPTLGLIFVLLSHYFLDFFPHKEYSIKNIQSGYWKKVLPDFLKVFSDIGLGFLIVFLIRGYSPLILIAAFLAILPDSGSLIHYIFPKNRLLKKHWVLHSAINTISENKKIPAFWGIVSQTVIMAIAIYLLK